MNIHKSDEDKLAMPIVNSSRKTSFEKCEEEEI
jgi:hypothetical protein